MSQNDIPENNNHSNIEHNNNEYTNNELTNNGLTNNELTNNGLTNNGQSYDLLKKLAKIMTAACVVPYLIPTAAPLKGNRHAMAYPESRFITLYGMELHYRLWEPETASQGDVMLLHGFVASTFCWRHVVPALVDEGYRVVAIDQVCFGLSERVPGFSHSQEARAMVYWKLLDSIRKKGEWQLVGHSMGGGTIAAMALDRPAGAKSLTFIDAAVYLETLRLLEYALFFPPLRRMFKVAGTHLFFKEKTVELILEQYYNRKPTREELDGYYLPLTIADSELIATEFPFGKGKSIEKQLGDIRQPALCVWGGKDPVIPVYFGRKLAADLPCADLVIFPAEGHNPMETAPEAFNGYLLDFLKKHH